MRSFKAVYFKPDLQEQVALPPYLHGNGLTLPQKRKCDSIIREHVRALHRDMINLNVTEQKAKSLIL